MARHGTAIKLAGSSGPVETVVQQPLQAVQPVSGTPIAIDNPPGVDYTGPVLFTGVIPNPPGVDYTGPVLFTDVIPNPPGVDYVVESTPVIPTVPAATPGVVVNSTNASALYTVQGGVAQGATAMSTPLNYPGAGTAETNLVASVARTAHDLQFDPTIPNVGIDAGEQVIPPQHAPPLSDTDGSAGSIPGDSTGPGNGVATPTSNTGIALVVLAIIVWMVLK